MINQEDVTIIIPHLGATEAQRYALQQCLSSLIETVPTMKKIVAVNGAHWKDANPVANFAEISSIHVSEQGQCKAVNAAVATVSTPWVLVTNDDMIFPPGWFERLNKIDHLVNRTISPILVEPTPGAPTFLTHFCGGAGGDFDKQKFLDFSQQQSDHVNHLLSIQGGKRARSGFNLPFLISKELWDLVQGYDVNYDPWGSNSDSDLEYKIKLAGGYMIQITDWFVYHFSQTSGTFSPEHQDAWQKNWEYFIQKWGFPRAESPEIWTAEFEIPKENKFHPFWEGHYGH